MSDPINPSSIPPKDMEKYQKEYSQSVILFEQALQKYHGSSQAAQKAEYKKVMEQMLPIIKELMGYVLKRKEQSKEGALATDFQSYMKSGSEDDFKHLNQDINSLSPNQSDAG